MFLIARRLSDPTLFFCFVFFFFFKNPATPEFSPLPLPDALPISLFVRGGGTRPPLGRVETARDHRLPMAFAVLGTIPGADVRLSERASVAISYPRYFSDLRRDRKSTRLNSSHRYNSYAGLCLKKK